MRTQSYPLAILTAALLLVGQHAVKAQMEDMRRPMEPMRGISVSGTGEVRASPDIAYVTLGARTRASQADEAAAENAAVLQRAIQAVRGTGIAEADIQTVQYTLQPVFEYPPNAPAKLTGYEAMNLVRVTVRDLTKVGKVIDAAVSAGSNIVQDVAFSLRNESDARARALVRAAEDGRTKAAVMAKALDVKLGRLISASEGAPAIVTPVFARAEAAAAPPTPISPREIEVHATVNLVYSVGG